MKKLNKNFKNKKMTVEAMADSCMGSCSCNTMSCATCNGNPTQYSKIFGPENTSRRTTFKNAAW